MPKIFPVSFLLVAPIILVGCGTIGRSIADALERNNFFYLDSNNVTIKCESADVGDTGTINAVTYTKRSRDMITTSNAATTCTSGITDLSSLFINERTLNENFGHWNTEIVTTLYRTFSRVLMPSTKIFVIGYLQRDQPVGDWNTESLTNVTNMFINAGSFNQDISLWCTEQITDRSGFDFGTSETWIGDSASDLRGRPPGDMSWGRPDWEPPCNPFI